MRTDRPTFFIVEVDDEKYGVELIGKFDKDTPWLSLNIDGKQYKIKLARDAEELITVTINGRNFTIRQEKTERKTQRTELAQMPSIKEVMAKIPLGRGAVTASMPGKVVAIKVNKGDHVKAGDLLCVLEAMKMENEIVAQKDGFVKEVFVSTGSGVNKGDAMFVIEPSED